ncbi:MAG: branched-chain amino acid ABC transporter permease, partial [Anaerolineales bacterium]|nr:branched-chain amino acid ABC transporter permease [Anaerolineales bacterium]
AAFPMYSFWGVTLGKNRPTGRVAQIWPWVTLVLGLGLVGWLTANYPVSIWHPEDYARSPISFSLAMDQGTMAIPEPSIAPLWMLLGLFVGSVLLALTVVGFQLRSPTAVAPTQIKRSGLIATAVMIVLAFVFYFGNDPITTFLFEMPNTLRFFLAMAFATGVGVLLGGLIEVALIRPLYSRPIYQIMITLGLSFILIEFTRFVWGRPEFTMPKPDMFNGRGDACPATNIGDLLANNCATIQIFDARIRYYNEVFIIAVGLVVLVAVWLLLQRTRLGMIIRAGVQDSEMVEALGINVRQVFTAVFALGVGLATLGGVLAAPSLGLSNDMGTRVLLLALIALAIGGLTSFPGAAAGAILVGLMQQFIIKYGQIGINLPFLAEPFKPSPPLVPASTILLMVIILLILPHGLFGRNE